MTTNAESDRYMETSRNLVRQAEAEFAQGDLVQASEKAWGAVAVAIKSIAQNRGWNHKHHRLTRAAVGQLCDEFDRPHLHDLFDTAEAIERNFYDDTWDEDQFARGIELVKQLLAELEELRPQPPRPFPFTSNRQRERWRELTQGTPLAEPDGDSTPAAA